MSTVASPAVAPKVSSDQIPWNKHTHQKRTVSDWIVDIVIALLVIAIVAVVVYPLWFIIVASFSDQTLVSNGEVTIWPKGFNVAGYERVFQDTRIWTGYRNTILYTVVGTALNPRIQFVSATLVFGLAAFDCSLAISSSHTSLGVL